MINATKMVRLSLATVTVALVGCGTTPYVAPNIQGNATLDFSSAHDISTYMFYANGDDCTGNFSLTEDQDPLKGKTNNIVLKADQRVAFNFIWFPYPRVCNVTVSFKPEANGRYGLVAGIDNTHCRVNIIDKKNNNLPVGPNVDFKQMKYVMGLGIRSKCTQMEN